MHRSNGSTASEGVNNMENIVFCVAALAQKEKGTMYTNAARALPVLFIDGHTTVILLHMIMSIIPLRPWK